MVLGSQIYLKTMIFKIYYYIGIYVSIELPKESHIYNFHAGNYQ